MNRAAAAFSAAIIALALACASGPAAASALPAGGLTKQEVVSWFDKHGVKASIQHDSTYNNDYVAAAVKGINFGVWFYNCDKSGRCKSLEYAAGWGGSHVISDKLNDWNRDNLYLRAYIARDGALWATYDIDIAPGGTWEQLDFSLNRWAVHIANFKSYMGL
jgi:Putative bacterial sensory transduction regulator